MSPPAANTHPYAAPGEVLGHERGCVRTAPLRVVCGLWREVWSAREVEGQGGAQRLEELPGGEGGGGLLGDPVGLADWLAGGEEWGGQLRSLLGEF